VTQKKVEVEEHKKLYQVKKKTLDVLPESELTISKLKVNWIGAFRPVNSCPVSCPLSCPLGCPLSCPVS